MLPNMRTISKESMNTATCRSETATDDADGDGQPDNSQPLYRARNGVVANGEDGNKIYIERSTRGAEAQLGTSDYAADDANTNLINGDTRYTWSLLASSQDTVTQGAYKKLVMVNGTPVILVQRTSGQCIALKPVSLALIKQSTQPIRSLGQTTIPQGQSCST